MKSILKKSLVLVTFCVSTAHANVFLDAARVQVDKVTDKKPVHKSPLEFKQAVIRYIKNTDLNAFQKIQRHSDENIAYKKELRYLFKNYGKYPAITLLSRLRSAHQTMVKQDTDVNGDAYRQYEQICSALLLTVSQVFCNEMRNQILYALHDIDNLLAYWNYQHNHQVYYFFHKSPVKWVMGKEQEKEIAHNIIKLERKQYKLYTLLGSLTEHLHSFTETGTTYQDCYAWIEQLFQITADIKIPSQYSTDESAIDELAAILELKLKRVGKFKTDCLASILNTKKPNRFVRNWMLYSTALVAMAYIAHYNSKNPEVIPSAFKAVQDEASKFLILLLHPLQKIYERGKLAFSTEKKENKSKKQMDDKKKEEPIDRDAQLVELTNKLVKVGSKIPCEIAAIIERSNSNIRKGALDEIREVVEMLKKPNDGWIWSSSYTFDEKMVTESLNKIEKIVVPLKVENIITNKEELSDYQNACKVVKDFIIQFKKDASWTAEGFYIRGNLKKAELTLTIDEDFLDPLQGYTGIIDKNIIPIFEFIVDIADNIVAQARDLIAETKQLEKDAAEELKYINKQLKDHELTLMFTSLIPLGITALAGTKAYKWATTRDYSSIRIALSDVNSLLIEAAQNLDDYNYGKLVYLICKLRHKATYLKDSLANEFLDDVAKLESKQYSAQTKHDIVENMFNKYAFLGKIAI